MQRVQNCLARVVLRAPRFSPSLPLLKQLHWLPVNYRIQFKLSTLTYRALAIHQPPYLASLLHFSNIPRQLRSSTSQQLSMPRTKLNLDKRAFSVAEPIIWNERPTTLKNLVKVWPLFVKISKLIYSKLLFHRRRPLILMMTPMCPRFLNMINDFVLLRFRARAPRGFKRYRSYIYYYYYYYYYYRGLYNKVMEIHVASNASNVHSTPAVADISLCDRPGD